jgi:hypothetical protein
MTGFVQEKSGKWVIDKDPDALLDYSFDWTAWLAVSDPADTITTHAASIVTGTSLTATIENSAEAGGIVTVWVSGGAAGEKVGVRCRITSASGRIDDRTVYLKIKER